LIPFRAQPLRGEAGEGEGGSKTDASGSLFAGVEEELSLSPPPSFISHKNVSPGG